MEMGKNEVHRIVEYIRMAGVEFDAVDVEEDVDAVLATYGFTPVLSEKERALLTKELLPLGFEREVAEVLRIVNAQSIIASSPGVEREYVLEGDLE